jgi:hypothetical protein
MMAQALERSHAQQAIHSAVKSGNLYNRQVVKPQEAK